mgnify:CR=1 FL=1
MANLNYIIKGMFDSSAVDKAKGSFGGLSSSAIAGAAKVAAGFAGVSAAVVGATAAAVAFVASTNKAENDSIRLAQVQKNNFEKLGISMSQLEAQTKRMQSVTIFDNNSIQQAQAALMGIGAVTKDSLDRVMNASADLASFLGTDITGAAQQLGKALAEPVQALGALERAGIRFSDAETKMIKSLVEAGRSAEAQDVILKKLESTIGGTAEAMGQGATAGAVQLKNSLDDLKNALGTFIGSELSSFFIWLGKIAGALTDLIEKQNIYNNAVKTGQLIESSLVSPAQQQIKIYQAQEEQIRKNIRQMQAQILGAILATPGGETYGQTLPENVGKILTSDLLKAMTTQNYNLVQSLNRYIREAQAALAEPLQGIKNLQTAEGAAAFNNAFYKKLEEQQKTAQAQTQVIKDTGLETVKKLEDIKSINRDLVEETKRRSQPVTQTQAMQGNYGLMPDMGISSVILDSLGEAVDPLVKAFITLFSKIESVNEILNWAETVIKHVFMLIDQPLKDVLKPVLDALFVLAAILAGLLLPILQVLAPVIKIIADGLILLFNYAIRPLANGIIFVLNTIMALIGYIWNGIAAAINAALGWAGVRLGYMNIPQPNSNFIAPINPADYGGGGTTEQTNGSQWSGAAASYSGGKEVNVYISFAQSFVNGDARQIALMLRDEIKAAEALGY